MSVLDREVLPAPLRHPVTADELECMPSEDRFELIRGELCPMPNNSAEHGNKTARLSAPVIQFVEENDLGECFAAETRFIVAEHPDTVLGPDFAYISKARMPDIPAHGYLRIAPDLVIETRSPGDTRTEAALKVAHWLQSGVQVVWALDPDTQSLTVHRQGETPHTVTADETLTEPNLLPGFELSMRRVFRPPSRL